MNSIWVNPDEKHILAATATNVILHGQDGDDEFQGCIVVVPRAVYLAAVAAWLDVKAVYYKHTREFCGVGHIQFTDPKPSKQSFHLREYDDDPNDDENVLTRTIRPQVYIATTFDIDMEHG